MERQSSLNDPMYVGYEVTVAQREILQQHVQHLIRLDRYAYFVEADAVSMARFATRRAAG